MFQRHYHDEAQQHNSLSKNSAYIRQCIHYILDTPAAGTNNKALPAFIHPHFVTQFIVSKFSPRKVFFSKHLIFPQETNFPSLIQNFVTRFSE